MTFTVVQVIRYQHHRSQLEPMSLDYRYFMIPSVMSTEEDIFCVAFTTTLPSLEMDLASVN